jgi:hypothetical protein
LTHRQGDCLDGELPKKRRRSEVAASKKNGSLIPSAGKAIRNQTDAWSVHAVDCVALSSSSKGHAMKFPRRRFLQLAAGTAALPAASRFAWAQSYP